VEAAVADSGSAAPARERGRGLATELHRGEEDSFRGSVGTEEGRRAGLHGGARAAAAMVGRWRRSGPGMARLGLVREGEWSGSGKTSLGEANGEGEFGRRGA